jgi:N-formylglutamate deformylase
MTPFEVLQGDSPVILGQPHGGTVVPPALMARLNDRGRGLSDTDWHIGKLYDGLLPGVTIVRATFHRYVIDANRDPSGVSLYPGRNTTSLCPTTDFDGNAIWRAGEEPGTDEIADRAGRFHAPYHAALAAEVARVKARHGVAIVYDCHSIRSTIPFLFPGLLPTFCIGTNDGQTCAASVSRAVTEPCLAATQFASVLDGRFKGGWTTRHYGQPADSVHAIQMELAQRAYLVAEAPPWEFSPHVAAPTRSVLAEILLSLDSLARSGALNR